MTRNSHSISQTFSKSKQFETTCQNSNPRQQLDDVTKNQGRNDIKSRGHNFQFVTLYKIDIKN